MQNSGVGQRLASESSYMTVTASADPSLWMMDTAAWLWIMSTLQMMYTPSGRYVEPFAHGHDAETYRYLEMDHPAFHG